MENKQIVDGVDISECEFCDWKGSDRPQRRIRQASFEPTCKGYNCYYKQLKAKEQECEKLKQALTEIKDITEKQCNICEALTPIDEYKDCKKCWQGKILQKISEVNNGR